MASPDPKRHAGKFGIGTGPVPLEGPPLQLVEPPRQAPRYAPHAKQPRKEKP